RAVLFVVLVRPPPTSTLFPYTTLFRSSGRIEAIGPGLDADGAEVVDAAGAIALPGLVDLHTHLREPGREDAETVATGSRAAAMRSEEHTSELQSRENLVCRLLLEKKNK